MKLKAKPKEYAVYHSSSYGPTFGGGHDLKVNNLSNSNRETHINFYSYEFPNGKSINEGGKLIVGGSDYCFQTVEIEVFKVL